MNNRCGFFHEQFCLNAALQITSGGEKMGILSRPKLPRLVSVWFNSSSVPTKPSPKHVSQLLGDWKNIMSKSEMVGRCEKETEKTFTTPVNSWQLAKIQEERKDWKQTAPSNMEE